MSLREEVRGILNKFAYTAQNYIGRSLSEETDQATDAILKAVEKEREVLFNCLLDIVNQSCQTAYKDGKIYVDDMALSAYEDALFLLEEMGYIEHDGKKRILLDIPLADIKSKLEKG